MQGMRARAPNQKVEQEIAPAVNQVWEDCDQRITEDCLGEARQIKILSIDTERGKAFCETITTSQKGRKSHISLKRFRPTSTGYRYVRTDTE